METPATSASPSRSVNGSAYAVLRQGGASPHRSQALLGLEEAAAGRLERGFQARAARGAAEAPRFARHEAHVAAVMAQGGFCAFSERRQGRDGWVVCLPLIWPEGRS